MDWWALQGLNLHPAGYEPASPPIEIKAHKNALRGCIRSAQHFSSFRAVTEVKHETSEK